jgi:hypothetical protein
MFYLLETILAPIWVWMIFAEAPTQRGLDQEELDHRNVALVGPFTVAAMLAHRRAVRSELRAAASDLIASAVLWSCMPVFGWVRIDTVILDRQNEKTAAVSSVVLLHRPGTRLPGRPCRKLAARLLAQRLTGRPRAFCPLLQDDAPVRGLCDGGKDRRAQRARWRCIAGSSPSPRTGRYDTLRQGRLGQPDPRQRSYPADGRWYSNESLKSLLALHGDEAARLIPRDRTGRSRCLSAFCARRLCQSGRDRIPIPSSPMCSERRAGTRHQHCRPRRWDAITGRLVISSRVSAGLARPGAFAGRLCRAGHRRADMDFEVRIAGLVFGLDVMQPAHQAARLRPYRRCETGTVCLEPIDR